jgi:hypothetical protein
MWKSPVISDLMTRPLLALSEATGIGLAVTVAIALLGWAGAWVARRRREKPHIVFHPLRFYGAGQQFRPNYRYAVGFRIENVGHASALNVTICLADPREELFAEVVTRPALHPQRDTVDYMGIRGESQEDDPSEEDAEAFYERGLFFVVCADERDRSYIFWPGRPHVSGRAAQQLIAAMGGGQHPHEIHEYLFQSPSRGERRPSLGTGRFDDE